MVKQNAPRYFLSRTSKPFSHIEPSTLSSAVTAPSPPKLRCGSDAIYLQAASIFRNALQEKANMHQLINYGKRSDVTVPKIKDEAGQRRAFELAFNSLKYQELLEDIMIDSCFYLSRPVPDDLMSLVAVMLYELQDRKFLPYEHLSGHDDDKAESVVRKVEECLLRFKTKLAASLARCRIKHNLLSIDCILPESIRQRQQRETNLPIYAWVNTLRTSMEEVCNVLKTAGFSRVESIRQLERQTFCGDSHCLDLLAFPTCMKQELHKTSLLKDCRLVMQDKSCCVGPSALRSLLGVDRDVLMAGLFSTLTVAHTAAIVASVQTNRSKNPGKQTRSSSLVYVCIGKLSSSQREELQKSLTSMGCSNVKLLPESLHTLDVCDVRLQNVQLVLLTPQCSLSAVSNPIDYLLQENRDTELLWDLSQGSMSKARLEALVSQQERDLQLALHLSVVQAVIYSTCSSFPEENEEVVRKALTLSEKDRTTKLQPFRLVRPSLRRCDEDHGKGEMADFFRLQASNQSNGCFLAVLVRQSDPKVIETALDIIDRAITTGLLNGIEPSQQVKKERCRRKTRKGAVKQVRPPQARPHVARNSQSQVHEFLEREMKERSSNLRQAKEKTNGTYLPQGKNKLIHQQTSKPTPGPTLSNTEPASSTTCPASSVTVSIVSNKVSVSSGTGSSTYTKVPAPSYQQQSRTNSHRAPRQVVPPPAPPRVRYEVLRPVLLRFPSVLFPSLPTHSASVRNNHILSYLHCRSWICPAPVRHARISGTSTSLLTGM